MPDTRESSTPKVGGEDCVHAPLRLRSAIPRHSNIEIQQCELNSPSAIEQRAPIMDSAFSKARTLTLWALRKASKLTYSTNTRPFDKFDRF